MNTPIIKLNFINQNLHKFIPKKGTPLSGAYDIYCAEEKNVVLKPLQRKLIRTGMSVQMPDDFEMLLRPRSGLAYKHGITLLNTPATIDSDYRGEIKVLLINLSDQDFCVEFGVFSNVFLFVPNTRASILYI